MNDTLVVYHGNCPDGFGAALAAWLVFGDQAEYWPADYSSEQLPDVRNKDVYVLDYSFDPEVLHTMETQCKSLTLLDHHKTAQQKFQGYRCLCAKLYFDMNRSGARMAWDHFHPGQPAPYLIERIEDRDLWRWQYEDSAQFLARLGCEPWSLPRWAQILEQTQDPQGRQTWLYEGSLMQRQTEKMLSDMMAKAQPCVFQGVEGLMLNCAQPELVSELGNRLATKSGTYGLIWSLNDEKLLKISLRSNAPFDVSALVSPLGGGGHAQASAVRLPKAKILDLLTGTL